MSFMFSIMFGVVAMSLNIFQCFQILSSELNVEEFLIHLMITLAFYIYMFFANYLGQKVTDHFNLIFITAYDVRWYATSIYIQKLIQFLLLRSNKPFDLKIGKMSVGSLQCFATLTNATVSYFIAMNSVKK
ncbi:odorant receptor 30a-like [Monomorium pharaonis]|uniref:odorant receptor 30a-like n=1 Tax=Monomorium pharaonis TaxID=307658 RepID=UPI00174781A8|nr:odorant receptor 30a-like [Monomorium pharaonis]